MEHSNIILLINSALLGVLTTLFFYIYKKMIDSIIIQKGMEVKLNMLMDWDEKAKLELFGKCNKLECDFNLLENRVIYIESKMRIKK